MRVVQDNQFDTISRTFSIFPMLAVEKILAAHGLALFDVEDYPLGGS